LTVEWWNEHRQRYELFISELVLREFARGDECAASKRIEAVAGMGVLDLNDAARELARLFVSRKLISEKAVEDAFHVAVATSHGMDFLLTWNCRHIANAEMRERLEVACFSTWVSDAHSLYAGAVDGSIRQ